MYVQWFYANSHSTINTFFSILITQRAALLKMIFMSERWSESKGLQQKRIFLFSQCFYYVNDSNHLLQFLQNSSGSKLDWKMNQWNTKIIQYWTFCMKVYSILTSPVRSMFCRTTLVLIIFFVWFICKKVFNFQHS